MNIPTSFYLNFAGVCVNSAGLTCHPKKKPKIFAHKVVLYNANGTQVKIDAKWFTMVFNVKKTDSLILKEIPIQTHPPTLLRFLYNHILSKT